MFILIRFVRSPVRLCFLIICQILICRIDLILSKPNIWLIFIFLLIYFGGMIVLFMYVRSVSQNEFMFLNLRWIWLLPLVGLSLRFDSYRIIKSEACQRRTMFSSLGSRWGVWMLRYLLIIIILVVKLTRPNFGALRSD